MDNSREWADVVVRWGGAATSDRAASGEGMIAELPVFLLADPDNETPLAREATWMMIDAFQALRYAHPGGPSVQAVHDVWRDVLRGIQRRTAEATIYGVDQENIIEPEIAGLIATKIDEVPMWIAVSSGGVGLLENSDDGVARVPERDDVGYDLPGYLWTMPIRAGQRFVLASKTLLAAMTLTRMHAVVSQLPRAERAAATLVAQPSPFPSPEQAAIVVDVLTLQVAAGLASPPTLDAADMSGAPDESEQDANLDPRITGSWGLEALGVDSLRGGRHGRRSHSAPPEIDDFRFVSYLGSGGFSDVYLYEEQLPKRMVAIKVLSRRSLGEGGTSQFRDEVDLMAQLSGHPSVVSIHDADIARSGQPYVVMQYCPLPSLAERLATGPLQVADAIKMGVQIAGAVHTAHVIGIAHHDLKPANVLYSAFGRPLLGDFGIATLVGASSREVMGASLPWAAPEVLNNQDAGIEADVYSLAATVYTALVGHAPFRVEGQLTRREYIERVLSSEPPDIELDMPEPAHSTLQRVLREAMARNPRRRTASAAEFGRGLQQVQAQLGLQPTDLEIPGA